MKQKLPHVLFVIILSVFHNKLYSQAAKKMNCFHTSIYRLIFIISLGIVNMSYAVDPITKYQEYTGNLDYVVTAGTFRDQANHPTLNAPASSLRATAPGDLTIPAGSTVQHAFLYWGGSGSTPDPTVTFDGQIINSTRNFVDDAFSGEEYFGHFADVTTLVQGQTAGTTKTYIMQNLTVDNGGLYFSYDETEAVWSLVVIYSNPSITEEHSIFVYDGWEMLWNSGGTGSPVPSNNITFNITGINVGAIGSADITSMIYEGDAEVPNTNNESIAVNGNILASGNIHATTSNVSGVGGSFPSYGLDIDRYDASAYVTPGDNSLSFTVTSGSDMIHISTVVVRINTETIDPCDPIASGNTDSDSDGISDICDQDDDNDGILDVNEATLTTTGSFAWTHNTTGTNIDLDYMDPNIAGWFLSSSNNESSNGITVNTISSVDQISSITSITYAEAEANNEFLQYSFSVGSSVIDPKLTMLRCFWPGGSVGDSYQVGMAISDDNFVSSTTLNQDISLAQVPSVNTYYTLFSGNYNMNSNATYTIRIYVYNVDSGSSTNNYSIWDDFFVHVSSSQSRNIDGDSFYDHLDLDSDNDGIPDNVEAQQTIVYNTPSGTVNNSGAEIGLWDNYGVGITPEDTDSDGTPDFIDSDSDNDGMPDIQENGMANVSIGTDTDSDGLDDNFEGGNLNDPLDVNDEIDNPSSSILPDSDFDLGTGGDLDYRDPNPPICTIGADSDGDGIRDVCDLDDDNDGIPDVNELGTIISTEQQPCGGDTPLDFSTPPTLLSGTDKLQGAVYRFPNISTGMDAIVTIVETYNATVADVDRNVTTPSSFKPRTGFNFTDSGEYGYIEYKFEFVNSGGFVPQVIPKFFMNFNDLDGGATFGETNWAENPKTYTIDDPTEITMSLDGSWVIATGAPADYGPSTNEFPYINFAVNYTNHSEITIRVGAIARVPGVSSSGRSHSIEFNCVTNYVSPQTYSLDGDYDGLANHLDLDSDNDGILDAVESGHGQPHTNGVVNGPFGTNGLSDLVESTPGSNSINYVLTDTDGIDGSNYLDADSDNDGCYDALEGSAGYDYTEVDVTSGQLLAAIDPDGVPGGTSQGIGTSQDASTQSETCITGSTIDFDGIDDYVEAVNSVIDGLNEYTISLWCKYDGPLMTGTDKVFVMGQKGLFEIFIRNYTVSEPSLQSIGGFVFKSNGLRQGLGLRFDPTSWVHFTVTVSFDGTDTSVNAFRNGWGDSTPVVVTGTINTNSNPFRMGIANGSTAYEKFNGSIDEVRIFDRVLTHDQIQRLVYQEIKNESGNVRGTIIDKDIVDISTNATIPWTDLITYYPMTNMSVGKIKDESSYSHDADLYNITTVQEQTAPLPYETVNDGNWTNEATWLHGDIWDIEDMITNFDGSSDSHQSPEPWSIVKVHNNVTTSLSHRSLGLFIDDDKTFSVSGDNEISNSWYLQLDGTLDLADDSQLIQTENSDLVTSAAGKILRRQEGNANYLWYNYWASPVGALGATTLIDNNGAGNNPNNTPFALNMLKDHNGDAMEFTTAFNETGKISTRWLHTFKDGVTYYDWVNVDENANINPGIGYTQKGTGIDTNPHPVITEQQYTFEGKPNNGTIRFNATDTGGPGSVEGSSFTSYLIGNPYPSALDADEFIRDNIDFDNGSANPIIQGTLLLWEQWAGSSHFLSAYEGGYGFINLTESVRAYQHPDIVISDPTNPDNRGIKTPTKFIPVGQAFFVEVVNNGDIEFNNGQRVFKREPLGESVFFRSSNTDNAASSTEETAAETQILRLEFGVSSGASRSFVLGFTEDATDGYDYGLDGGLVNNPPDDDMGSLLNGEQYVIQAFAPYTPGKEIDLVLHASGNFTYTLESTEISNFPEDQDLFLKDLLTGQNYDLRSAVPYDFTSVAGSFTDRFKVVFQDPATLSLDEFTTDNTLIYVNQVEDKLYVKQLTDQAKEVKVTNMLGQSIKTFSSINNQTLENGIDISNLSPGVYVISIKTANNQSIDKKVIIN